QVVLFAVTAVLGLALTRQLTAELEGAERWTPNTSWIGLVAIVVAITGVAVVPASTIASPLVELRIYLLLAALLVVGAVIGWTRQTVAGLIPVVLVYGLAIVIGAVVIGVLAWLWARDRRARVTTAAIETRFIDRSRGNE